MTLSDGISIVYALMTRAKKNIDKKPKEYRTIYNLYYMAIYVALQDSFDYGKEHGNAKNKADFRWRNARKNRIRIEAKNWLLNSDTAKLYWEWISDSDYDLFRKALLLSYKSVKDSSVGGGNEKNKMSREISTRLSSLSV